MICMAYNRAAAKMYDINHLLERSPRPMDTIVLIMFASVLCTMTALNFIELRRIRKKLESK